MPRLAGWPERLFDYIERCRSLPYDPLTHNCAVFAGQALAEITGEHPIETLGLEMPQSATDAGRILVTFGGVAGLASAYFGAEPLPPSLAARGDVMIKDGANGDTLGICLGDVAAFITEDGVQLRPLAECRACWRLPP